MLQATQQGIGLVNGICMSGVEPKGDFEFTKNSVMYMLETAPELARVGRNKPLALQHQQRVES